jgi:hypothetical protein
MAMKGDRFILGEGIDTTYIRIETVGEGKVDDPINSAKGDSRFGPISGKGIEPFPPATG